MKRITHPFLSTITDEVDGGGGTDETTNETVNESVSDESTDAPEGDTNTDETVAESTDEKDVTTDVKDVTADVTADNTDDDVEATDSDSDDGEATDSDDEPEWFKKSLSKKNRENQSLRNEVKAMRIELAVTKHAAAFGVDADTLTDSRKFTSAIEALDHTADTYGEDVKALIEKHLEASPHLSRKRAPAAPFTKPNLPGGAEGETPNGSTLEAEIAAVRALKGY